MYYFFKNYKNHLTKGEFKEKILIFNYIFLLLSTLIISMFVWQKSVLLAQEDGERF